MLVQPRVERDQGMPRIGASRAGPETSIPFHSHFCGQAVRAKLLHEFARHRFEVEIAPPGQSRMRCGAVATRDLDFPGIESELELSKQQHRPGAWLSFEPGDP